MPIDHSPTRAVEQTAVGRQESQSPAFRGFPSASDESGMERRQSDMEWQLERLEGMFEKHRFEVLALKNLADRVKVLAKRYNEWYESVLQMATTEQMQLAKERFGAFDDRIFELSNNIEFQLSTKIPLPTTPDPYDTIDKKPATGRVRAKLPEIVLPHFDGNIRDWPVFRDAFRSLIDSAEELTDSDKLHYLAASLTKDARAVIEAMEITAANYPVAWNLLSDRYENKYLIVKSLVEAIFNLAPLTKECSVSLNRLVDEFERNLRMLEKEGENTDTWSTLLVFRLSSLLDPSTLRHWEFNRKSTTIPKYQDLVKFIRNHCHLVKSVVKPSIGPKSNEAQRHTSRVPSIHAATSAVINDKCKLCGLVKHSVFRCETFQNLSVTDRKKLVQSKGLCFNCLSTGHQQKQCTSSNCKVCGNKHHTLLHDSEPAKEAPQDSAASGSSSPHAYTHCSIQTDNSVVLLQTVLIQIEDNHGRCHPARALLDSGAQLNLMSERFAQLLGGKKTRENHRIGGIGQFSVTSEHTTVLKIRSRISEYSTTGKFHILSKLTSDLPLCKVDISKWQMLRNLKLADPSFHNPGPIDLIIGAELYYDILEEGLIKRSREKVILQNTAFGWVVTGRVNPKVPSRALSIVGHVCSATIEEQLHKFWELETCRSANTLSVEESRCERQFAETTIRHSNGRFIVQLPKREEKLVQLGESKRIATRRFLALERRLSSNPTVKSAYTAFMNEYKELQHMTEVSETNEATTSSSSYYLPHHCIVRPDSTTTKLRVVFDASCASESGTSLNDALMIGPTIQDDLVTILLRFRMPKFAMVADIEKMYRQIIVAPNDRPLQRILWRNSSADPIRTFQLNTVTYGTACAPYLATKTLQTLSQAGVSTHPEAAAILGRDFYMDDMLTGVDTISEGQRVCQQITDLLASGGFHLRKWASNNREIIKHLPENLLDERTIFEIDSNSAVIKTLGLKWNVSNDVFLFTIPSWNEETIITKRSVLSDIARLFDPLGLVGPIIVQAKLFLQVLWRNQITWDKPLASDLQTRWLNFRDKLAMLKNINIPRWLLTDRQATNLQLHCFCDASEKAYGAAIYLRSTNPDGSVTTNLIIAKSKVAPLADSRNQRRVCLPRLELSGALLLAHLYEKVSSALQLQVETVFWSDSTIVLHWLAANPSRWKTFIANRVSEIQHITQGREWKHVPGKQNPADIISRGMDADQLNTSTLWWHGPEWLAKSKKDWPHTHPIDPDNFNTADLEERKVCLPAHTVSPNEIFSLRSTYTGLQRIVAWLRRFRYNTNPANRDQRKLDHLSLEELAESTLWLVRVAQAESFKEEITNLTKGVPVNNNSSLKQLAPVLQDGLLRVGGRLRHAPIPMDRKHPYILPANHPLTTKIATYYHRKYQHAGPQLLIASMRERFWPLRAKNLARKTVHSCHQCFRCRPTSIQQIMGDLPAERVTPTQTFLHTGVDLCGPIYYRQAHRKAQLIKGYIAIFICMAVKAVHIELVADLSTNAFISALRRFIARRGKPALIECDNARNFLGASREIASLNKQFNHQWQSSVIKSCIDDCIKFKFIPPRSPNFGGLWEAAVKSFKTHFRPTIGNAVLTSEELNTLLVQIEGCMNSRPLTPMSNEPSDLEVLTPGHFLIHRPIVSMAEPSLEDLPFNRLDRWQRVQEYLRRLWKRWSTDYLSGLQPRTKWTKQKANVQLGTMVLLKEEGLPPSKWCLGRIIQIIKGADDNVRVVVVKTKDSEFKRAISKICVLPTFEPNENR